MNKCLQDPLFPTISRDPLLSADQPTSPKKPKSIAEPDLGDEEGWVTSPTSSEWTSVRINPREDMAEKDVLAVCVLVTSDDSRYVHTAGWDCHRGCIWDLVIFP